MKKRIIFDCDCTMGVAGCDVDDGLALLYLLGCPEAEIAAITASFGNGGIEVVWDTLTGIRKELGLAGIPLKKGAGKAGDPESEAADFLAFMAGRYPGEISVLATGSLTNLFGAWKKDPDFFKKIKDITLMGGITEPLIFEKKKMDELNFSCDPKASFIVLAEAKNLSVITGNSCLKVLFTKEDYQNELFAGGGASADYIRKKTDYWFRYNEEDYGIRGFYNWDVTAAVYFMHPELFEDRKGEFCLSEEELRRGYLRRREDTAEKEGNGKDSAKKQESACRIRTLNLPVIRENEAFKREIYRAWKQAEILWTVK